MSEVRPFLAFAPAPVTRTFGDALATLPVATQPSPWTPQPQASPPAPSIDVETLRAEAIASGRAAGLAETAELRARLRTACEALAAQHVATARELAELVAEATCAAVGAWASIERRTVLTSIINAWTTRATGDATVRVHPDDVSLVEGCGMTVVADPAVARGDVVIAGSRAELVHAWRARLGELAETIVTALAEGA